jgi:hypothetical protein
MLDWVIYEHRKFFLRVLETVKSKAKALASYGPVSPLPKWHLEHCVLWKGELYVLTWQKSRRERTHSHKLYLEAFKRVETSLQPTLTKPYFPTVLSFQHMNLGRHIETTE